MYKNKTVAVVILCYNEEMQISDVIASIPLYIDRIIVVDDASTDNTFSVANSIKLKNNKVTILSHDKNQGCGGALATGYKYVRDNNIDIAVRMDGDGQMLSRDLELITLKEIDFFQVRRTKKYLKYDILAIQSYLY